MKSVFANLSVRYKIWLAMGVMLVLLIAVVGDSRFGMAKVEKRMDFAVSEVQPLATQAQTLVGTIESAMRSLGFYLLTHESQYREEYGLWLDRADGVLAEMGGSSVSGEAGIADHLKAVRAALQELRGRQEEMFGLVESQLANFPAFRFAAAELNPRSQKMLQLASAMIQSEQFEEANEARRALLMDLTGLRYAWSNVMNGVRAYLSFRGKSALDEVQLYREEIDRLVTKLQGYGDELTFDQVDQLEQFSRLRDEFFASWDRLLVDYNDTNWRADATLLREEVGPLLQRIREHTSEVNDLLAAKASAARQEVAGTITRLESNQFILLVIALVVVAGVMIGINHFIVAPAQRLRDLLRDIADGEGDLTQRCNLDAGDELGEASRYFNRMMEGLQAMMGDVAAVSRSVREGVELSSQRVNGVAANAVQVAARVGDTATAAEELSATSAEIARNAEEAAGEAARVEEMATNGTRSVEQMNRVARQVGEQVGILKQGVDQLEEKSRCMLEMVDAINDIANQTNLLALNAAIEAARAGEMGRGFAVVADEVRQLAIKTQESTSRITTLISDNQQSNEQLARTMEELAAVTGTMLEGVESAAATIRGMHGGVESMNGRVSQIAAAAAQQAAVTQEVSHNIESVSAAEQENADGTQEVVAQLAQLDEMSERLSALVARFRF